MMANLPKVKLKALPNFPSSTTGGTGIDIENVSGNYTVSLDVSDFQITTVPVAEVATRYAVSWGNVTTDNPDGEFWLTPYSSLEAILLATNLGIVGDNATLNDTAIAAAIAYCVANNRTLAFTDGIYRHSGTLNWAYNNL